MVQWFELGSHWFSTFPIFTEPEPPLGRTRLTRTGGSGQNSVVQGLNWFRTGSALNPGITITQLLGLAGDNASNNQTMTEYLTDLIPSWGGEMSQVRCITHIINLVEQVCLFCFWMCIQGLSDVLKGLSSTLQSPEASETQH